MHQAESLDLDALVAEIEARLTPLPVPARSTRR